MVAKVCALLGPIVSGCNHFLIPASQAYASRLIKCVSSFKRMDTVEIE